MIPVSALAVSLGRLRLPNPVLVASGTFGYAREMAGLVDFRRLGGIVPKTVTLNPRAGNPPPRTAETSSGLLNAIGLDNDGLEYFLANHLPWLSSPEVGCPVILNIAAKSAEEFPRMAARVKGLPGIAALELNLSCPNVAGGIDFATKPDLCRAVVASARDACPDLPLLAKLTPNVTSLVEIAQGAADGGCDAVSLVNTFLGIVIDWRRKKPVLGNGMGGLSGPAIKPLALRCVWQVARAVNVPVVGIGGIATIDDVMEFIVAGASAVQMGTVNFYNPTAAATVIDQLPEALATLGVHTMAEAVGLAAKTWQPLA
ncbi:MAG: dihydroorotate dehydrogenase [Gemmataceae bacterium]